LIKSFFLTITQISGKVLNFPNIFRFIFFTIYITVGNIEKDLEYSKYILIFVKTKKMAHMKNLIIYKSHWELIEQLSVEQVGYLMKGIAKFCKGEEVTFTDPLLTGIWLMMKRDFVIQSENYEKKKEANRKNGLKGGRPKSNVTEYNPQNPMGYLVTQQTHNIPQNLKERDIDIDIEKEKDIDNSTISTDTVVNHDYQTALHLQKKLREFKIID